MQLQNENSKGAKSSCFIPENKCERVWIIFIANGEDLLNSCNICGFENSVVNIKDEKDNSTSEFITHFNTQHKEAFIDWLGQDVWWKNSN